MNERLQKLTLPRVVLAVWLAVIALLCIRIVFFTAERGSGMNGLLWYVLALYGGGIALIVALASFIHPEAAVRKFPLRLLIAATFFAPAMACRYGSELYLKDQEEGKAFIEARIAEIRKSGSETFPATQAKFINGKPLPRFLRNKTFYHHDGGANFHIESHIDFDGAWMLNSETQTWRRST